LRRDEQSFPSLLAGHLLVIIFQITNAFLDFTLNLFGNAFGLLFFATNNFASFFAALYQQPALLSLSLDLCS
jgi:hypothetical protein